MNVSFEIPQDIEQQIRSEGVDPNREAREAYGDFGRGDWSATGDCPAQRFALVMAIARPSPGSMLPGTGRSGFAAAKEGLRNQLTKGRGAVRWKCLAPGGDRACPPCPRPLHPSPPNFW
jgi:hypothetical protein